MTLTFFIFHFLHLSPKKILTYRPPFWRCIFAWCYFSRWKNFIWPRVALGLIIRQWHFCMLGKSIGFFYKQLESDTLSWEYFGRYGGAWVVWAGRDSQRIFFGGSKERKKRRVVERKKLRKRA